MISIIVRQIGPDSFRAEFASPGASPCQFATGRTWEEAIRKLLSGDVPWNPPRAATRAA